MAGTGANYNCRIAGLQSCSTGIDVQNELRDWGSVESRDAVDWLAGRVLQELARSDPLNPDADVAQSAGPGPHQPTPSVLMPHALTLVLRRYAATGRPDLAEAFGLAIAQVLESRT